MTEMKQRINFDQSEMFSPMTDNDRHAAKTGQRLWSSLVKVTSVS